MFETHKIGQTREPSLIKNFRIFIISKLRIQPYFVKTAWFEQMMNLEVLSVTLKSRPCLTLYNSLTGYKEVIFIQNSSKNL